MRVARVVLRLSAPVVATVALFAAPVAHAAPGLVGAYGFEESSGTTATDTSGAGNPGAITGATRAAAGRFGAALSFDGVDDRVNVNDANALDLSPAMTLSAWVRPTNTDWRTVLLKERPGGLVYALYASTETNRPSAEVSTSGTFEARGTAMLPASTWSHLTTTYDGTTLRLYVNGTQVASRAVSGSIAVSSGALRIGGNAIWGEYFRGLIDEVRVYNRALSVTELQADMNAPVVAAGDTSPPTAPSNLQGTGSGLRADLTWNAATDNVGVTGYRIHRSTVSGFTPDAGNLIATLGAATSYRDTAQPGTYHYRVVAADAAGNTTPSAQATVVVPGSPPVAPPNLTVSSTASTIGLTWASVNHYSSVTYRVHRSTEDAGFTPNAGNLIGTTSTLSFTDATPATGTLYYAVLAVDAAGLVGAVSRVTTTLGPDTTPPTVTILRGCDYGTIHDYVPINASVTDDRPGVTRRILIDGQPIATPLGADWESRTVSNGPHVLSVEATDAAGNVGTAACDIVVHNPTVSAQFVSPADGATVQGLVSIQMDPRADGEPISGGDMTWLALTIAPTGSAPGSALQKTRTWDTTQVPNGVYTLRMDVGWMDYSNPRATKTITVTVANPVPDVAPPSAPGRPTLSVSTTNFDVGVSWAASTDDVGVTGYRVHRSTASGFTPSEANRVATVTGTTYTDTAPNANTFYYAIVAVDAAGNSSPASPDRGIRVSGPPVPKVTSLAATPAGAAIRLDWEQPAFAYPLAPYRIYRSTTGSGYTPIGTSSERTFTDPTPPTSGSIYYQVVAYSAAGTFSDATTIQTSPAPDTTPPTVTFADARGGCPTAPVKDLIDLFVHASDDRPGVTAELLRDGERVAGPSADVSFGWNTATVPNGTYVFTGIARDAAGNETRATCAVMVANPTRAMELVTPADGATLRGVVPITVDVRQNGTSVTTGGHVSVFIDGVQTGNFWEYTRNWDTRNVANGAHTIRVELRWTSTGSYVHATRTIEVTVDNSVPVITGVTAVPEGAAAKVSWTAAAADAGITGYRVHRGISADFTPAEANRVATTTSATTHTDADLAPGTYFYKVVGVAGAQTSDPSAAAEVTISPDTTPPVVALTNAACNGHTVFDYVDPLRVSASDDRGEAVTLEVFVDDTRIRGPVSIAPGPSAYQFQWNTRAHADGEHTMKLVARDAAGNEGTFNCLWTVDNKELTVPIVVSDSPVSGTVTVRFAPKADGADVTTPVAVTIDGVTVFSKPGGPYEYTWDTTTAANGEHTIEAKLFWSPYNSPLVTATKHVTVQNAPPAPTGLVAAYGFEETSGASATDGSPAGSTGTISGAIRSTEGRFGRALSFDGVNDLVNVPDANTLDLTTGMTLSAWVRPTALGDWRTVVMKSRPGGLAYALYAHTDTNRPAGVIQTASEQDARGGASQLPLNAWTHLATTYDGANVRLYVNGAPAATRAATGSITVSTGALQIGGNSVWSEWFKGLIDEVRVYSRALSADEIAADRDRAVVPAG